MERERLSWQEMKERYPDQWLLIVDYETDDSDRLVSGVGVAEGDAVALRGSPGDLVHVRRMKLHRRSGGCVAMRTVTPFDTSRHHIRTRAPGGPRRRPETVLIAAAGAGKKSTIV
jgi:hypothetical protein